MNTLKDPSPLSVRRFFAGKHVLLTGATGFLAKAVVEKLLRDLPDVGRIYLLIRPRRKSDGSMMEARERLHEEVLRNSAFGRLREKLGENFDRFCESKITCINGDLTKERLGLEEAAYRELAGTVQVIINSAATVVFDERLDLALSLNTIGPTRLLELAQAGRAIYVHISTAYVSGMRRGHVPEKLLSLPEAVDTQLPPGAPRPARLDVQEELAYLQDLTENIKAECARRFAAEGLNPDSEAAKEQLNAALVEAGMKRSQCLGWNDTYTYTKFLGEQLVCLSRGSVPTLIVRPSIIESSLREPEPGWLDGLRMADPIIIGFGKGRLPDFPANKNIVLDIIPADLVVNGVLAGTAHIARHPDGFDLMTIASSAKNPLWFQSLYDHVRDYYTKHPFTDKSGKPIAVATWRYPTMAEYRRRLQNRYLRPARLASALLNGPLPIPGARKWRPRLKNTISRMEQLLYYVEIYGPYVNLDCRFEIDHALEIQQALDPAERTCFDFDPRKFHWRQYLQDIHIPGLKRNILRMEVLPRTGAGQGRLLEEEGAPRRAPRGNLAAGVRGAPQTIVDLCQRGHERLGDKVLVEIRRTKPENGPAHTRLSYTEMFERSGLLARQLAAQTGLGPGERVVLLGENCPEWPLAYLAIARAGGVAVPLDRSLPLREVAQITQLVEAKALLVSPAAWKTLAADGAAGLPTALNLVNDLQPYDGRSRPAPAATPAPLREPAPEALASILFTSGTTLEPKGVMLSHANLVTNAMSVSEVLEPMPDDRFLSVLPLHHAFEFTCGFLIPTYGGATVHYLETLRGQEVLNTMKLNEITVVLGVPRLFKMFRDGLQAQIRAQGMRGSLFVMLGHAGSSLAESLGLAEVRRRIFGKVHEAFGGHLRLFVSGGAALDPEIFHYFRRFGLTICEGYGLTETAPVLTVNPLSAPKAGSVGPPVPGTEINIENLDGDDVGEILARGPSVMHGYWKNAASTEKVFAHGWFRTGDLGRLDPDGYLHITGRLKDVIVTSAGKKVHPDEVEHALRHISGIKELCVIGLPGRTGLGEEVVAVVVPESDNAREEIVSGIAHLTRYLPTYQHVSRVEFQTEELPKTSTLKIQRGKVRQSFASGVKTDKAAATALAALPLAPAKEAFSPQDNLAIEVARAVGWVANVAAADVQPHQKLQMDLGIDSIGRVDLLQHLELRLGISLPADLEGKLFTVRDVVTVVEEASRLGEGAVPRPSRNLWERASVKSDALLAGLEETVWRRAGRGLFEAATGLILSTHVRVRCDGLEHLPQRGPYILAANHASHLDVPSIRKALGLRAATLHAMAARDYFFDTALKRWFFTTCLNALPLDREANAAESLAVCKTVLDHGRAILIFPEGTRSVTGELQPFKPGIGVLAIELDVPLIPVWIQGSFAALPKGRSLPRAGAIDVRFGPPVDMGSLKRERGAAPLSELYRKATALLREQVEALANLPPLGL